MNKRNRKYRKLQFIRRKNRLRLGEQITMTFKVSLDIASDSDLLAGIIEDAIATRSKKFRLLLKPLDVVTSMAGDDYAKELVTVLIHVKHGC